MRLLNRHFMKISMSRVILIALLISIYLPCRSDAESAAGPESKHVLFFDTGGLLGGETDIPQYVESSIRLYSEAGYEFETSPKGELPGNRFGLAVTGALGTDDIRVGISPRATLRLGPAWSVQGSGGLVWSSKEEEAGLFDQGWQVRGGLLYKDTASFTVLYQALPYSTDFEGLESGTQHSIYAGVMIHGKPGAIVSAVAWGAILAAIGLVLLTDPPS